MSKVLASAPAASTDTSPTIKEAEGGGPFADNTEATTKPTDETKSEEDNSKKSLPAARAQSSVVAEDMTEKQDSASQHTNKDGSDGASAKQQDTAKTHSASVSAEQNMEAKRSASMTPATAIAEENIKRPDAATVTKDSDSDSGATAIAVPAGDSHEEHDAKPKDEGAAQSGSAGEDSSSEQVNISIYVCKVHQCKAL